MQDSGEVDVGTMNELHVMLEDMEAEDALYQPTTFWSRCAREIVSDIETLGIDSFRRHPSALLYYVPEYPDHSGLKRTVARVLGRPSLAQGMARSQWAKLPQDSDLPLFDFSESDHGEPRQHVELDGRRHSRSSLNYLRGLAMLHHHVDASVVRSALEIGGGYGTLGEILLKGYSDSFYVNVDIPPLAHVSAQYLRAVFGQDAVAGYEQTRDMEVIDLTELRQKYRAVVLCAWQLPRVQGRVDLFCNFISFQEMEPETVQNYARQVQPLTGRFLLLRNSSKGQRTGPGHVAPAVDQPILAEDYREWFSEFELVAADDKHYGDTSNSGWRSEVTVFRRIE